MIDTVYIDMDGVLVDFLGRCWEKRAFDEKGRVDWKVVCEIGPDFWATMNWLPGSKEFLEIVVRECDKRGIEVGILSAIDVKYGELGKRLWCKWNTPFDNEHVIIVAHGAPETNTHKRRGNPKGLDCSSHMVDNKSMYAKPGRLLIDDNMDNNAAFRARGGDTIQYDNPEQALLELMEKITADD